MVNREISTGLFLLLTAFLGLSGCAIAPDAAPEYGITPVSGNVYEVMDVDHRGIFGSESSLIERNLSQVNDFAASRGKIVAPLEARIHRVGILGDWAWFYYRFALVDPTSPEAGKAFSESMIIRDVRLSGEFYENRRKDASQPAINPGASSRYDELIRLDELRKKGILSEKEFAQEKARILNSR